MTWDEKLADIESNAIVDVYHRSDVLALVDYARSLQRINTELNALITRLNTGQILAVCRQCSYSTRVTERLRSEVAKPTCVACGGDCEWRDP